MIATPQPDTTGRIWATIKTAEEVTGLTRYHIMKAYAEGAIRAKKTRVGFRGTILVYLADLLAYVDNLPDWTPDPRITSRIQVLQDDPPPPIDPMTLPRVNHPDWKPGQ